MTLALPTLALDTRSVACSFIRTAMLLLCAQSQQPSIGSPACPSNAEVEGCLISGNIELDIGARALRLYYLPPMAMASLALLSFLLFWHIPSITEALGPVEADIQRPDGLCALLVNPVEGYACREYTVQTDDQFLVGVQRVSKKEYLGKSRGPVFVLHGILLGGDVWFLNLPEQSLVFMLADQGYDVWVGNTRTTRFSYGHVKYTKKDKGFWDWSVDELGEYDLSAMMGLVQSQTNQKLHYIGYSQASQQAFAAFSQGKLVDMVSKVVFVAPVAYINHVNSPIATLAGSLYIDRLFQILHVYEFSTTFRKKEVVDIICRATASGCFKNWISIFTGNNCCLNVSRRVIIDTYETQATSTKNLVHLAQQLRKKTFAKYDYGFWGNIMTYGRFSPPAYDLSKVPTSNTLFIHGGADALADPKDVAHLFSLLPNGGSYPVSFLPEYAHIDFILGTNANQLVYKQILDFLAS
ncbi:hypothetical protein GOP47_0017976 [Adiantum capillus-veneris]|uniref:Partial AB-hydrolase lipase domain-containing protein n=1 Tax=Adiantum capillus-veneris TaxID=13818 RepID=A0A9D4Z9Q3_ADICA|nr:hypothetical protein GOP47_0017976 [Adiantum capillus-veneris]